MTYANGVSQSLTYDLAGNVTGETDAEGNAKQYEYDPVGRLVAVVDELGNTTTYTYDALDNIAKVTDALGHVTEYTYDKNSNLTSETDALGNQVSYAYTPEGWLSSVTKADGAVLTYQYDNAGSLLTQNVGEGRSISSSYNELGMVTKVTSEEGTIVYQYNGQGYLVSVTNVNGDVVSYAYDEYGNKTAMTYPDGRKVTYEYDGMNRMTSVTGLDGEKTTYAYDAASRRIETASGTLTTANRFDNVGNLLEQVTSGASEIAFAYSYNKNGYITGEVRTENGVTTENSYTYDALGQLTSFLQSTGYGERYTYDAAGNMTEKVVTGTDGAKVALAMSYNAGNQLVSMAHNGDSISYSYDANGSMVQKILTSEAYGTLTDAYTYDGLDQLTGYVGYDGYQQAFAYDANGMRLSKRERGETTRSTLEELLRGNIAGMPEVVEPMQGQSNAEATEVPDELAWATTDYLYDITQEYYQVIQETTASASGSTTTAYAYGLERIAAYSADSTTSYVYDGRGSVAQTVTAPMAGDAVTSALPDVTVQVQSFVYTAFGEQMGSVKVSGFAYNAEAYDAATGMMNLRARQYEPALSRFGQKDVIRGQITFPLSFNRYAYCVSSPIMHTDPSGQTLLSSIGNWWNNAKQTIVGKIIDNAIVKPVINIVKKAAKAVKSVVDTLSTQAKIYQSVRQELEAVDESRPTCQIEKDLIWRKGCAIYDGNEDTANKIDKLLKRIQSYDKYDWLFLTGDCIIDDSIPMDTRFAMLDILKEKQDITAEDLIELGLYTEETRYHPFFFGLFHEDVAGNFAALLELSYRVTRQDMTVWELSLEEQRMHSQQMWAMFNFMVWQAGLNYSYEFNASGNAIRMPGASNAAWGYESIPSDFRPFDYSGTRYEKLTVTADSIQFSDKFLKGKYAGQPAERGWTTQSIADAINNPIKTETSYNPYTGNSVTLYYVDEIHYVAVDDGTHKVIQITDLNKRNWVYDNR